jgi:hypothetical protein
MMNEDLEKFEQRLRRQTVKQVPGEWRAEILSVARSAQVPRHSPLVTRHPWLSIINHKLLSTLLWPHPKAWAGLAAVWLLILTLNFSMRDKPPVLAVKALPPSPEVLVQLRQQQKMLAELMGPAESRVADRQRFLSPKPRSERGEILAV